jgi:hypothetical protein
MRYSSENSGVVDFVPKRGSVSASMRCNHFISRNLVISLTHVSAERTLRLVNRKPKLEMRQEMNSSSHDEKASLDARLTRSDVKQAGPHHP